MEKLKPFAAIRPPRALASLVSTRSYVTYKEEDLWQKLSSNPYSLMHVLQRKSGEGEPVFMGVRKGFVDFLSSGYLVKETNASYYIYRQTWHGHAFTGIIGLASLKDYQAGRIKPHEATLAKREQLFAAYLETVGFHAEPILLTHEPQATISSIIGEVTASNADVEFATTDMAIHCLWPVPQSFNERIAQAFGDMDAFYVADGHHRIASSKLLNKRDGVMAFVLDESQLHVTSFHRIVSNDQASTWIDLGSPLKDAPQGLPESGIYAFHGGNWYHLTDEGIAFPESQWLFDHVLHPCMQIIDERDDARMRYLPGDLPLDQLIEALDEGDSAFVLPKPHWKDVRALADRGETVPPKSTYIEPKLRSGITLYAWE